MDLKSASPFWPSYNESPLPDYPRLDQDLDCEAAVIGGGISGALLAHCLVEAGVETVLLERRTPGGGSTSASTALLQYEIDTHLTDLTGLIGEGPAVRAYRLCLESLDRLRELVGGLDDHCGYSLRQSLYYASTPRDVAALQREYRLRCRHGFRVEWLEAGAIRERFAFAAPAALLSRDAAQVDPYRLAHRLLEQAVGRGLRVFERTHLKGWRREGAGLRLDCDGPSLRVGKLFMAVGYEAAEHLSDPPVSLNSTYAIASEPVGELTGWPGGCLIWESARPYLYLRTTPEGHIIVGGEDEPFRDPQKRDALIGAKAERLEARFRALFPDIPFRTACRWAGTFGETRDGLAYIGEPPGLCGCYFALGFGGNGITFSTIAAPLLRDLYLGRDNPDAALFAFDRRS